MKQLKLPLSQDIDQIVKARFEAGGVKPLGIDKRAYPEEIIRVVRVTAEDFVAAGNIGNSLDRELADLDFKGFVTVRKEETSAVEPSSLADGVADPKVAGLTNLIAARSRTSEIQPSLEYIPDTARNIELVLAPRHQLIFGRRGAGKTALMVEAKRRVSEQGNVFVWINLQTLRMQGAARAYIFICQRICDTIQGFYASKEATPKVLSSISGLQQELESCSGASPDNISSLVPRMQQSLKRFLDTSSVRLYIFIDELHYLARSEQPNLLDMVHGCVRECDAWVKVAGIRHLSRWFQAHPPLGLQTGHDADPIHLDLKLEN